MGVFPRSCQLRGVRRDSDVFAVNRGLIIYCACAGRMHILVGGCEVGYLSFFQIYATNTNNTTTYYRLGLHYMVSIPPYTRNINDQ